jgi:hypothetical protein
MLEMVDFYTGIRGAVAHTWLGSIRLNPESYRFAIGPLTLNQDDDHEMGVDDYLAKVRDLVADFNGSLPDPAVEFDGWPHPYATSSGSWRTLCWVDGSVHEFERGGYLVALYYPNATRKPGAFPKMR